MVSPALDALIRQTHELNQLEADALNGGPVEVAGGAVRGEAALARLDRVRGQTRDEVVLHQARQLESVLQKLIEVVALMEGAAGPNQSHLIEYSDQELIGELHRRALERGQALADREVDDREVDGR